MKFILSPVGTSILTNGSTEQLRGLLTRYANTPREADIPDHDAAALRDRITGVSGELMTSGLVDATKLSAELNGIVRLYGSAPFANGDVNCLLATDTWLGTRTAEVIAEYLRFKGSIVEVYRQRDLQTDDFEGFQNALAEIAAWCAETVQGYRDAGYDIVFNLTGGYKSVQGFLQTLAMFYADETVYVFEKSANLMRIPRLPIRMDAADFVLRNLFCIRRLAMELEVEGDAISELPETFVLRIGETRALSGFGEIVWRKSRDEIYKRSIHPPPSRLIRFGEKFEGSIRKLKPSPDRFVEINRTIDQLACYLESGNNPRSLDFKELRGNPCPPSTHEADAWQDGDAGRLFGHFHGDAFILDKLDKALH